MNDRELDTVMQKLVDGDITREEFAALEEAMKSDPAVLETYRMWMGLHVGLDQRATAQHDNLHAAHKIATQIHKFQRRRTARISLVAAAAVVCASLITLLAIHEVRDEPFLATVRVAQGSAYRLISPEGNARQGDQLVQGGRLELEHGAVELKLPHQVRAVVEAPASLKLLDESTLQFDFGRAYFEVPSEEGHGFTVVTPHQRIVDVGTAFGYELIPGKDHGELHVLEGRVRVDGLDGKAGPILAAPCARVLDGRDVIRELDSTAFFRKELPKQVETVLREDFESGIGPGRSYSVQIQASALRAPGGQEFTGIAEGAWTFESRPTPQIRNPSFEANDAAGSTPVRYWDEVTGAQIGANTRVPGRATQTTHGRRCLTVDAGRIHVQRLGAAAVPGATYVLKVDVAGVSHPAKAMIRMSAVQAGQRTPLAELEVAPGAGQWLRDQSVAYTASSADAQAGELAVELISLEGRLRYDQVRLRLRYPEESDALPQFGPEPGLGGGAPEVVRLIPEPHQQGALPGGMLHVLLNQPVEFGFGVISVTDHSSGVVTEMVANSANATLAGSRLSVAPKMGLADGDSLKGEVCGWDADAYVEVFNPSATDDVYAHPHFHDDGNQDGVAPGMLGPTIASVESDQPGCGLWREIARIQPGRRYTVSIALGVRPGQAGAAVFPGACLQLLSGGQVLSEVEVIDPPAKANHFGKVGLFWDALELPDGVVAGDPLILKIIPMPGAGPLDLDHVWVTATRGSR